MNCPLDVQVLTLDTAASTCSVIGVTDVCVCGIRLNGCRIILTSHPTQIVVEPPIVRLHQADGSLRYFCPIKWSQPVRQAINLAVRKQLAQISVENSTKAVTR